MWASYGLSWPAQDYFRTDVFLSASHQEVQAVQGTPLSATLSLVMSQCCRKIKDTVQKLASDHKDIHSSVSRVGKAIDRNFDSEICGVVSDAVWDSREKQQQTLQMAILEHLYQQGMLSVAEELCQESTLNVDLDFKQPFLELNRILEALHEQDLGPALEYVGLWVVPQGTGLVCSSRHPAYLTHLQPCLTGLT